MEQKKVENQRGLLANESEFVSLTMVYSKIRWRAILIKNIETMDIVTMRESLAAVTRDSTVKAYFIAEQAPAERPTHLTVGGSGDGSIYNLQ